MPFNGTGTFNVYTPGNPVVQGTIISPTTHNSTNSDIATGLSNCVTRDGQSAATANLPMGGFKLTNLAAGTARTDSANLGNVQDATGTWGGTSGGAANVQTLTLSPAITAYAPGQTFRFIAGFSNTGATTVNINALGAKNVFQNAAALIGGEIVAGRMYTITYDGTQFRLGSAGVTQGVMKAIGIRCNNNAGTPNTQYDLDADYLQVANGTDIRVVTPVPSITNNISTAGPAANGRDQAGAFTDPSFVHFYWIWNGSTLATISSASAPTTGPTLPTGYTHWAYAGAVYFVGGALRNTYIIGKTAYLRTRLSVLAAGASVVEAAVSLTAAVPANTMTGLFSFTLPGGAADPEFRFVTGATHLMFTGAAAAFFQIPVLGQQIFYRVAANSVDVFLNGYELNNAE